jgi:hypothetical protein
VKFGPRRMARGKGQEGRTEIFLMAHRSAWVDAAELPECVRARFGFHAK